jgi:hypothetical protein
VDQKKTKSGRVQRLKGWFLGLSRRTQAVILLGILVLALGVVGSLSSGGTGGKRSMSASESTSRSSAVPDISEDALRGIYYGMADEDFRKIIGKLGRPAVTGRQPSPGRFSCKFMAAWRKADGRYLLLHCLESTDPRNGSKRVENFRTWDNQTLQQVEDLKWLLK